MARMRPAASSASARLANGPTRTRVRSPLGDSTFCRMAGKPASTRRAWALSALAGSANRPTLMPCACGAAATGSLDAATLAGARGAAAGSAATLTGSAGGATSAEDDKAGSIGGVTVTGAGSGGVNGAGSGGAGGDTASASAAGWGSETGGSTGAAGTASTGASMTWAAGVGRGHLIPSQAAPRAPASSRLMTTRITRRRFELACFSSAAQASRTVRASRTARVMRRRVSACSKALP